MIKVKITRIPLEYFHYFQWLILGLFELSENKEIRFTIRPKNYIDYIFLRFYKLYLGLRRISKTYRQNQRKNYCLEAEIIQEGNKISICYDIADCPYYFDAMYLSKSDLYFKAQCPKDIKTEGFHLAPEVKIPYDDSVFLNINKIMPSMLGPSCRSNNIFSYKALKKGYNSYVLGGGIKKEEILMCYFGNSKGPKAIISENSDLYNNESEILGHFANKISHPNEKRAEVARIISSLGKGYDGRIINDGYFGADGKPTNAQLFIPLKDYTSHIAKFKYNMNVSGNRMSIPNRFIYSFAVGTAIVTDKLAVKWYKPFVKEVIETIEMGYLKIDEVNWKDFRESIIKLPEVKSDEVFLEYIQKWSPEAFAKYVINTSLEKLNQII